MCDIRAFGKEIMDLPGETYIHKKEKDSESKVESIQNSPKSCKTFQAPDFGSDLDLKECDFSDSERTFNLPNQQLLSTIQILNQI